MNADDVARGEPKAALPSQSGHAQEVASTTLMLLRLGMRWFGVDVRAIEEVALKGEVTRVPTAPSHILGVTTLRGRLVTVVGLEQMIGGSGMLSSENSATLPRLVVVRDGEYEMAVVAEGIQGMTEYMPAADPETSRPLGSSEFVREEFDWRGKRVSLLDAPMLIATAAKLAGILSPSQPSEEPSEESSEEV
jgi:purine-binding chemotaxis protein CheW